MSLGSLEDFRMEFNSYRYRVDRKAVEEKNSQEVWLKLTSLYSSLGPRAREMAGVVIGEWLDSDDTSLRSDAFYLIREFEIAATVPAIKRFVRSHASPLDAPSRLELQEAEETLQLLTDNRLPPNWKMDTTEVSAGVYNITATAKDGRFISLRCDEGNVEVAKDQVLADIAKSDLNAARGAK